MDYWKKCPKIFTYPNN